jgi:putative ABC transport system permease protein
MFFLKLIVRNALRHRLRTLLTIVGLLIAVVAYGLLQTVIDAWYAGAKAASSTRLVTRNAISLVFPLPLSYEARIRSVEGVSTVARANWFGGIYQDPKKFFAQFAVSANYLDLYPEFVLPDAQRQAWLRDRKGCLVGRQLADDYGFKVGDVLPLRGTIFPGTWEFVIRGIFEGSDATRVTRQMMFHWDYLNESVRKVSKMRADQVGLYIVGVNTPESAPSVARAIDATFRNSRAETLTESEQAFQLGFVAMSNEIIAAIRLVSYVVIAIIMAVMANTMAMSARERVAEYAMLKTLGFRPSFIAAMVFGESAAICALGGGLGIAAMPQVAAAFKHFAGSYFPVFEVSGLTVALQAACASSVAIAAAIVPAWRASRVRIVEGLRAIG